jgi:CDP-alcohol phosphatidyltransferase
VDECQEIDVGRRGSYDEEESRLGWEVCFYSTLLFSLDILVASFFFSFFFFSFAVHCWFPETEPPERGESIDDYVSDPHALDGLIWLPSPPEKKAHSKPSRLLSRLPIHENIYTVPNILTFSRILAAPLVGYLLIHNYHAAALSLFAYAGITDLIDGYIARKYHLQTVVGTIIDPAADKLLMTTSVICLGLNGSIPRKLVLFSSPAPPVSITLWAIVISADQWCQLIQPQPGWPSSS